MEDYIGEPIQSIKVHEYKCLNCGYSLKALAPLEGYHKDDMYDILGECVICKVDYYAQVYLHGAFMRYIVIYNK